MSEELERTYNPCDECPYGIEKRDGSGNDSTCKICEFADLVKANRRTQQPNDPLTVGELRKMDGQPVWVKAVDPNDSDTNYWAIVSANMHYSHKSGGVISTSTDGVAVVAIAYFEDYGKSWLAYRRPPEAGEKG